MSGAAQLEMEPLREVGGADAAFALKEQVAERLAAHRAKRGGAGGAVAVGPVKVPGQAKGTAGGRAAQIAAAVAERYANSPSYRAFLAAEAENAIRQAAAAAEIAAVTAEAVAAAQYSLLAELDELVETGEAEAVEAAIAARSRAAEALGVERVETPPRGITVRMYEETVRPVAPAITGLNAVDLRGPMDEEERLALEEEIAFRQAPVFDEPAGPLVEIPANLIEFPRQLVASRKARPRLAEGPLREEGGAAHDASQLRIFEVEPEQISTVPEMETAAPVWTSIMLGAQPAGEPVAGTEPLAGMQAAPQAARLELRMMAATVDGCIVLGATMLFAAAALLTVGRVPMDEVSVKGVTAVLGGGAMLLGLLYQVVCFTLSDATAGMRYARIGLCTLSDENPTRAAMRWRILAAIFSGLTLGIGFLWAWLDADGLGWHDRLSRMYQRGY